MTDNKKVLNACSSQENAVLGTSKSEGKDAPSLVAPCVASPTGEMPRVFLVKPKSEFLQKVYFEMGNEPNRYNVIELTPSLEQKIIEAVEKEHIEDCNDNHALQGCHRCHLNIFKALRDLVSEGDASLADSQKLRE